MNDSIDRDLALATLTTLYCRFGYVVRGAAGRLVAAHNITPGEVRACRIEARALEIHKRLVAEYLFTMGDVEETYRLDEREPGDFDFSEAGELLVRFGISDTEARACMKEAADRLRSGG